MAVGTGEP